VFFVQCGAREALAASPPYPSRSGTSEVRSGAIVVRDGLRCPMRDITYGTDYRSLRGGVDDLRRLSATIPDAGSRSRPWPRPGRERPRRRCALVTGSTYRCAAVVAPTAQLLERGVTWTKGVDGGWTAKGASRPPPLRRRIYGFRHLLLPSAAVRAKPRKHGGSHASRRDAWRLSNVFGVNGSVSRGCHQGSRPVDNLGKLQGPVWGMPSFALCRCNSATPSRLSRYPLQLPCAASSVPSRTGRIQHRGAKEDHTGLDVSPCLFFTHLSSAQAPAWPADVERPDQPKRRAGMGGGAGAGRNECRYLRGTAKPTAVRDSHALQSIWRYQRMIDTPPNRAGPERSLGLGRGCLSARRRW